MLTFLVQQIEELPAGIEDLQKEADEASFSFVKRLVDEFQSGENCFDRPGESLFAVYADERLVAIGGLNRDPYANRDDTGRIRHVYVLESYRRQGAGRLLLETLIGRASEHFTVLTLRTFNPIADHFYQNIGFQNPSLIEGASHDMRLDRKENP